MILLLARTTVAAVTGKLGPNYDTVNSPDLNWTIRWASSIVSRVVDACTEAGETLSTSDRAEMEGLLAAHAYTAQDALYSSRSSLSRSGSFIRDPKGDYLKLAAALDPTGTLEALVEGNRAGAFWTGKTETESLTWDERN